MRSSRGFSRGSGGMGSSRGFSRSGILSRDGLPSSRSDLVKSISGSLGPKPSTGMLVAAAAAQELSELDDQYVHVAEHHARLASHCMRWGEGEKAVEYLRQGLLAVQGVSNGKWRGVLAVARSRLALAAAVSSQNDHHTALGHVIDAMDEVETIYQGCAREPWKPGRQIAGPECAKVLCLARHMLATELEFLNAPADAVAELVTKASSLEGQIDGPELDLAMSGRANWRARHAATPAPEEPPPPGAGPDGSLLYRACVRAREALADDALARARKEEAESEFASRKGSIDVAERPPARETKRTRAVSREPRTLETPDEAGPATRSAAVQNVFAEFLSTSAGAASRREALVNDAPIFQKRFKEFSQDLQKDLEYKSVSDLHDMKIYHTAYSWPRYKRRLGRKAGWSSSQAHLSADVAGLSRELQSSHDLHHFGQRHQSYSPPEGKSARNESKR